MFKKVEKLMVKDIHGYTETIKVMEGMNEDEITVFAWEEEKVSFIGLGEKSNYIGKSFIRGYDFHELWANGYGLFMDNRKERKDHFDGVMDEGTLHYGKLIVVDNEAEKEIYKYMTYNGLKCYFREEKEWDMGFCYRVSGYYRTNFIPVLWLE